MLCTRVQITGQSNQNIVANGSLYRFNALYRYWMLYCLGLALHSFHKEKFYNNTRHEAQIYAAFTLSGFDDQERNLTYVKTAFQVLKLQFLACSMKQTFYPLHKQNIARA